MTVVAVMAEPPRPGRVLSRVVDETPLSPGEAANLYEASLSDAVRAAATSGGDLLVNYRAPAPDDGADGDAESADPETTLRAVVEDALSDLEDDPHVGEPRYEPQVGSTEAARVGNTVTHLLEEEGVQSAAALWPTAPLAGRTEVDGAAMKLRSAPTVLGPTTTGGVYYAGFTEPVDFEAALAPPAVETLAERTASAGGRAEFVETVPSVATPTGLATTTALIRARLRADRAVPSYTAAAVEALGLVAREGDAPGSLTVALE